LQTITMVGVVGPAQKGDRPSIQTRQSLYYDGVAMDRFDDLTGEVQCDRTLTTYQHNSWGSPDITFLDINTPAQVMYAMRRFRADMTQVFGRVALADSNPYNVTNIVTPDDIRKQMCHTYTKLVKDGAFQGAEVFMQFLQVEHDANDPSRVNASLPLWCVNQLRILAVAAIVYLQNPTLQIQQAPLAA
jgi:phage tail sheath gpL-like